MIGGAANGRGPSLDRAGRRRARHAGSHHQSGGHDEELAVFGSRDQYLRQVRDALGRQGPGPARRGPGRGRARPGRAGPAGLRGAAGALPRRSGRSRRATSADLIETTLRADDPDRPGAVEIREGNRVGPAPVRRPGALPQGPARERAGLLRRPGRDGQDLPGRGHGRRGAAAGQDQEDRPGPAGRRGRRAPRVPARATSRPRSTRISARCSTPCTT